MRLSCRHLSTSTAPCVSTQQDKATWKMPCQLSWVTAGVYNQEKNPDLGFFCQTCLTEGPEESQQLCCLHLSLPFLLPAMQNLLKTSVFSVINDDCSDQRGNLWPLLCTVHFSLSVCVTSLPAMNSSPSLNTTEYIWLPQTPLYL